VLRSKNATLLAIDGIEAVLDELELPDPGGVVREWSSGVDDAVLEVWLE